MSAVVTAAAASTTASTTALTAVLFIATADDLSEAVAIVITACDVSTRHLLDLELSLSLSTHRLLPCAKMKEEVLSYRCTLNRNSHRNTRLACLDLNTLSSCSFQLALWICVQ